MKIKIFILIGFLIFLSRGNNAGATGISLDAGLTPPQNRWIYRTQFRFMQRLDDPSPMQREMKSYVFPVVVAYGLRPELTVMMRQIIRRNEMTMVTNKSTYSGFADLLVMTKYRMLRINTRSYTLGIAPTVGLELPTGSRELSSNTWNLHLGFLVSGRIKTWGFDFNLAYKWNGMAKPGESNFDDGDEFSLEVALSRQFGFGRESEMAVAPVLETSYMRISPDVLDGRTVENTGESVFLLSPGIKFTVSSIVLEGLARFPVWQKQDGIQLKQGTAFIVGVRLMY